MAFATVANVNSPIADTAGATSLVISKPSGVAQNDIIFAWVYSATAYSNSVPADWTSLGKTNSTGFYELFYKVAGASEGASYTWGFASSQAIGISIIAFNDGFYIANPINVVSNTAYVVSNTTYRAASLTVGFVGSPLIAFYGGVSGGSPFTQPTGWTEDIDPSGGSASGCYKGVAHLVWNSSGAYGNIDATGSSTTDKHSFAVSLNLTPNTTGNDLLLETGYDLLQESGSRILLDKIVVVIKKLLTLLGIG
jgi:hypothetical protein